jgi:hypothetical protein
MSLNVLKCIKCIKCIITCCFPEYNFSDRQLQVRTNQPKFHQGRRDDCQDCERPVRCQSHKIVFLLTESQNKLERLGWVETNPSNIRKHLYLTSAKAVSVVPRGEVTDVCGENTDVRLVSTHWSVCAW